MASRTLGARRRAGTGRGYGWLPDLPDHRDRLYALELSDGPGFPNPGVGKLVRISPSGRAEDILTGLVVPTAMTIGPDGAIYISNFGAAPPGLGQIIRVAITD